jgi:type II secretory pathway component PulL
LKEDARSIQLRLEQLRLQAEGKNDAQLERTIEKYEQYLNKTAEKIAKMQEKYA